MGLFDKFKRANKTMEVTKELNKDTFWKENIMTFPMADFELNENNKPFLKDVIKNDSDIHRKTVAFTKLMKCDGIDGAENILPYLFKLQSELDLSFEEVHALTEDSAKFQMAISDVLDGKISVEPDENSYAMIFKKAIENNDPKLGSETIAKWSDEPDVQRDSNYLLALVMHHSPIGKKETIENLLIMYKYDSTPFDKTLASWYKFFAAYVLTNTTSSNDYEDLIDKYL